MKKKVLLMGKSGSVDVENSNVKFLGGLVLNLWDCIAGDAQVTTSSGLSYALETLNERSINAGSSGARGLELQSWNGKSIVQSRMSHHMDKQRQACMGLELEDGRVLHMTPDHEVLSVNDDQEPKFRAAEDLHVGDSVVCSALEGVSDDEELQYDLSSSWGIFDWKLSCERDRNRILALARLCGAMQGAVCNQSGLYFYAPNAFDVEQISNDVMLVTGQTAKLSVFDRLIAVPNALSALLREATGLNWETQRDLPNFINLQTPRSVLREFIAGWWGQSGSKPHIGSDGRLLTECTLGLQSYNVKTIEMVRQILHLLLLDQQEINGGKMENTSPVEANGSSVSISQDTMIRFVERIGVRYASEKLRWFNAAATFVRTTKHSPAVQGQSESASQFLDRIGFHKEDTRSLNLRIKRILSSQEVGHRHVYDIHVPGTVSFVANGIVVHNCGGQDAFMETYLESQRDHIFRNVEVLIYVFDIESREVKKDLTYYHDSLEAIMQNSKSAKVFCLIHKMDLIPEDQRERVFRKKEAELKRLSHPMQITCFKTSIWDETLYKAWSSIVYSLIPNVKTIEANLDNFTQICGADEVVLFERATFLVIAHSTSKEHHDVHRFEKISNIIKQFKLSCMKSSAQFQSMEVQNSSFSAYIEGFTPNTYVMVVVSDETIQSATVLLNIKAARRHFANFLNTATNAGAVL